MVDLARSVRSLRSPSMPSSETGTASATVPATREPRSFQRAVVPGSSAMGAPTPATSPSTSCANRTTPSDGRTATPSAANAPTRHELVGPDHVGVDPFDQHLADPEVVEPGPTVPDREPHPGCGHRAEADPVAPEVEDPEDRPVSLLEVHRDPRAGVAEAAHERDIDGSGVPGLAERDPRLGPEDTEQQHGSCSTPSYDRRPEAPCPPSLP